MLLLHSDDFSADVRRHIPGEAEHISPSRVGSRTLLMETNAEEQVKARNTDEEEATDYYKSSADCIAAHCLCPLLQLAAR